MTKETIYEPSEEIINDAVISNNEFEELYKNLAIDSFRKAGEYYNLKCPLTGEAKEGKNWMETH